MPVGVIASLAPLLQTKPIVHILKAGRQRTGDGPGRLQRLFGGLWSGWRLQLGFLLLDNENRNRQHEACNGQQKRQGHD